MLRKASTKTPTRTFQFSENFQVVVFLVTIKHYLLQVFEERNLTKSLARWLAQSAAAFRKLLCIVPPLKGASRGT